MPLQGLCKLRVERVVMIIRKKRGEKNRRFSASTEAKSPGAAPPPSRRGKAAESLRFSGFVLFLVFVHALDKFVVALHRGNQRVHVDLHAFALFFPPRRLGFFFGRLRLRGAALLQGIQNAARPEGESSLVRFGGVPAVLRVFGAAQHREDVHNRHIFHNFTVPGGGNSLRRRPKSSVILKTSFFLLQIPRF